MTKLLLTAMLAATFAFGLSVAGAQNVKSDQDKAQGQEQKMQEKEQGTSGAGQQSERERAKTNDGRNAPSAGGANSADKAETAMKCEGKSGHDKEECLEHANGKPADEDDAGAAGQHKESGEKYKR